MKQLTRSGLFIIACLTWAGCSTTKSLKPGQYLYTGADIKINPDSSAKIDNQKEVKEELESKTRPRPNKSLLGIKFKLGLYNLAGEPKKPKGGLRNWLRKSGEPPVLLSEVKIPYNNAVLKSYLISQGYLQSEVTGDTIIKGKKGKAVYTAKTGERYKINSVAFPTDSSEISQIVNENKDKTLLKAGNNYDLELFKNERIRIDNDLKERGFFYFSPDYLILQVDSTIGKHLVDIRIKVKDIAPDAGLKPYNIKDLFDRLIFFKKGENYNRTDHNKSLNRMVNIGVFQAVKAEFLPVDSFRNNQLNLNVYLTPLKKNSLTFSATGTSKSNNFVGSELKLTQTTRNLFRGAEQLDVSASGGFETQISGVAKGLNSYSFTTEAKLTFPRFITPFKGLNSTNNFIPKTIASLSYQLMSRGSSYNLKSLKGEFGYNWKESQYKEHTFNPISVNYVTSKVTANNADSLFSANPGLKKNLEKQFIIGSGYNFTYSDQMNESQRNNIYFNGGLEMGGNVWGLFASKNSQGKNSIFGIPMNQFVRLELDLRDYFKVTKSVIWANRLNLGYGYAYGNSSSLPFVRQFFAGGTNDIRAFAARSLGPGTYNYRNDLTAGQDATYTDQSGDIKAMLNTELRFKMVSILHGAIFVDAGNVWLRKEDLGTPKSDEDPIGSIPRPGSGFKLKNALKEMAIGTGAGLRLDATIFVIRLDVAFPVRKPYLPEGQRWVIDQVDFGNKDWRKENLIYNIGIGYPF